MMYYVLKCYLYFLIKVVSLVHLFYLYTPLSKTTTFIFAYHCLLSERMFMLKPWTLNSDRRLPLDRVVLLHAPEM